jgi:hypothetical protein
VAKSVVPRISVDRDGASGERSIGMGVRSRSRSLTFISGSIRNRSGFTLLSRVRSGRFYNSRPGAVARNPKPPEGVAARRLAERFLVTIMAAVRVPAVNSRRGFSASSNQFTIGIH